MQRALAWKQNKTKSKLETTPAPTNTNHKTHFPIHKAFADFYSSRSHALRRILFLNILFSQLLPFHEVGYFKSNVVDRGWIREHDVQRFIAFFMGMYRAPNATSVARLSRRRGGRHEALTSSNNHFR